MDYVSGPQSPTVSRPTYELLLACSESSPRALLNRTGFELYETLMREVFGDDPVLATIPLSPPAPISCTVDDARRHLVRALQRRLERSPIRGKKIIALLPVRGTKRAGRRPRRTAAHAPAGQESEANTRAPDSTSPSCPTTCEPPAGF